jgi:REP element-mobilizing transposase RayT
MHGKRILEAGAHYHVCARINRKEMLLEDDEIKELFLRVLREAKAKYSFSIEHFCIMGNHYHLIIKPGRGENLSAIMKWIMMVFAIRYNKRFGLTGHVWGDRFHSRIIRTREHFRKISDYLCENPVMAGLVFSAEEWPYGGLFHFRLRRFDILDQCPGWIADFFAAYSPHNLCGHPHQFPGPSW